MALLLYMLKGLLLSIPRKADLACIFCLGTVDVIFDILRAARSLNGAQNAVLWIVLELNVAVLVACLPVYRSLLGTGKKRRRRRRGNLQKAQEHRYPFGSGVQMAALKPSPERCVELPAPIELPCPTHERIVRVSWQRKLGGHSCLLFCYITLVLLSGYQMQRSVAERV